MSDRFRSFCHPLLILALAAGLCLALSAPAAAQNASPVDDAAPTYEGPCRGVVTETFPNPDQSSFELTCEGQCEDGSECTLRSSTNHHGGVSQWCGCNDARPETCYTRLYTPGDGEGGGPTKVYCSGPCPNEGELCTQIVLEDGEDPDTGLRIQKTTCVCCVH